MESMIIKALTLLFEGSFTSMLFVMLPLLNLKSFHGLSNVFMDELFSLGQALGHPSLLSALLKP
jgi:hypothetical protein